VSIAGAEKAPELLVICCTATPVALFLMLTVAPGMTPPLESTTSPERDEVELP